MPTARILLLSGGCLVGQNVLACLVERRASLHLAATNSTAAEAALYDFDAVYLTPEVRRDPELYRARFHTILAAEAPDLVVPCRDDDVSFLAAERDLAPAKAPRFLCGSAAVAEAMCDKLESAGFSARHGLPFVPTIGSGDLQAARRFARDHGWPLVAKPRRGFGSRGVRLILDEAQLAWACAQSDYVLQEYCGDGESIRQAARQVQAQGLPLFHSTEQSKLSIQASIAPDGTVTAVFATDNVMRAGRSERVRRIDDPDVRAAGRKWAAVFASAGWRGPLNMQGHRGPEGIRLYEYNGRFTGATAARWLLGFDEVGLALRAWLNIDLLTDVIDNSPEVVRTVQSRAARAADVERLLRDGRWVAATRPAADSSRRR